MLLATLHLDVGDKIKLETMNNKVPKNWFFIPCRTNAKRYVWFVNLNRDKISLKPHRPRRTVLNYVESSNVT